MEFMGSIAPLYILVINYGTYLALSLRSFKNYNGEFFIHRDRYDNFNWDFLWPWYSEFISGKICREIDHEDCFICLAWHTSNTSNVVELYWMIPVNNLLENRFLCNQNIKELTRNNFDKIFTVID